MTGRLRVGFTLLELLIAGAILVILLAVVGQVFIASLRAYEVSEDVSDRRQITQAALDLLRYEMSLSGYRCSDADAGTRTFTGLPFDVTGSAPVQSFVVRYFEDRFVEDACDSEIAATFQVTDGVLMRTVDGASTPIVEGVVELSVVAWLNRINVVFVDPQRPAAANLAGVKLRLVFEDGIDEVFTVGFRNSQCEDASTCL